VWVARSQLEDLFVNPISITGSKGAGQKLAEITGVDEIFV